MVSNKIRRRNNTRRNNTRRKNTRRKNTRRKNTRRKNKRWKGGAAAAAAAAAGGLFSGIMEKRNKKIVDKAIALLIGRYEFMINKITLGDLYLMDEIYSVLDREDTPSETKIYLLKDKLYINNLKDILTVFYVWCDGFMVDDIKKCLELFDRVLQGVQYIVKENKYQLLGYLKDSVLYFIYILSKYVGNLSTELISKINELDFVEGISTDDNLDELVDKLITSVKPVAIKINKSLILSRNRITAVEQTGNLRREYDTMKDIEEKIKSDDFNIVKALSFNEAPGVVEIIMDRAGTKEKPAITLIDWVKDTGRTPDLNEKIGVLYNIFKSIKLLNENKIAHCDLKPDNIMITRDLSVYIIDYGEARYIDDNGYLIVPKYFSGTAGYRSALNTIPWDLASFGAIIYAIIYGPPPETIDINALSIVDTSVAENMFGIIDVDKLKLRFKEDILNSIINKIFELFPKIKGTNTTEKKSFITNHLSSYNFEKLNGTYREVEGLFKIIIS